MQWTWVRHHQLQCGGSSPAGRADEALLPLHPPHTEDGTWDSSIRPSCVYSGDEEWGGWG